MGSNVKKGERVRTSTAEEVNAQIDETTMRNLNSYWRNGKEIHSRLRRLDAEWDIERTLELNAALFALAGTLLGSFVNRRWFILPVVVTTFLAQHAIQGWCPPLPIFRKMGIRTRREIDREKYALKALRGDFKQTDTALQAWQAVNK